jgi:hypothetical protein
MLIEQLVKYLAEVLNVTVTVRQWQKGERLPLFFAGCLPLLPGRNSRAGISPDG